MSTVISAKNLSKVYGESPNQTVALENASFEIKKGEFASIVGPSGSGKSTLMYLIGLLDRSTKGEIFIEGEKVEDLSEDQLAKIRNQKIGFVFQTYNLLARTSALGNVMLPLSYSNVPKREREERAKNLLEEVGLGHRIRSMPLELSGGEQQRVAIARALATDPSIVLADEPTGNLDSKTGEQILSLLADLNKKGRTILIVTHNSRIAQKTKRIITLKDGKIVSDKKLTYYEHF